MYVFNCLLNDPYNIVSDSRVCVSTPVTVIIRITETTGPVCDNVYNASWRRDGTDRAAPERFGGEPLVLSVFGKRNNYSTVYTTARARYRNTIFLRRL